MLIKETFIIDPYKGAAAMMVNLQKPGYTFVEMDRKRMKVVVTFKKDK